MSIESLNRQRAHRSGWRRNNAHAIRLHAEAAKAHASEKCYEQPTQQALPPKPLITIGEMWDKAHIQLKGLERLE